MKKLNDTTYKQIAKDDPKDRLLIVLLTDDRYIDYLDRIWNRIKELDIPKNLSVDRLVITDNNQEKVMTYCQEKGIPFKAGTINTSDMEKFLIDSEWKSSYGWTIEKYYRIIQLRNFYLDIAREGNYDWLLQVDGDVLPPKDGLIKLINSGKKYNGAVVDDLVSPYNPNGDIIQECNFIGNCFHLEEKEMFNYKYSIERAKPITADMEKRCEEIRADGYTVFAHYGVECKHLEK